MKFKHNKKRNTAFLFESLIREVTRASLKKDNKRRQKVLSLLKEFFSKNKILASELKLYKALYESADLDYEIAEKVLAETKNRHVKLNKKSIFIAQTNLINKINKNLDKNIFENFIPNYKNLATIYQVFYENIDIKKQIKMEEKIIKHLQQNGRIIAEQKYKPVSKLAFKTFYNKFNETYDKSLLTEQKELIKYYISSFEQDDLELKIFLNEEIGRLRSTLTNVIDTTKEPLIKEKKKQLINVLNSFSNKEINKNMVEKILKIQQLLKEINDNGH